ncbi:MAG TPA: membrane protein insertion efficiency factor YidD [Actinomycetota bacterium]|nr:membrane protein insertion efficiency factor YidD [Actinomycetota bacterium]
MIARALVRLVGVYQRSIGRSLPATCRFEPTCSSYALGSITRHGAVKGSALAVWRLLRCGPWSRGGLDPVPARPRKAHVHG